MPKNLLFVFGTRPEAIKMCPLILTLRKRHDVRVRVCVTGQHRTLCDEVLELFDVHPDFDLNIMKKHQTLEDITESVLLGAGAAIDSTTPELVLVHGDTTTTLAAALAAFYRGVPVAHVEAGLRTYNVQSPYPEEFNRRAVSLVASMHFAPTARAAKNLVREGIDAERVFVTGNTVVDALSYTYRKNYSSPLLDMVGDRRLILVTAHRRESRGEPMLRIFETVKRLAREREDVFFVCPLHPAPEVQEAADLLRGEPRIHLAPPLGLLDFHNLLARSYLILSDSGGVQEEALSYGVPVLVTRERTERPEGIETGGLRLVGSDEARIYTEVCRLLDDRAEYERMKCPYNPFGDGHAAERIADIIGKVI
ncbi:MAG: UDP-N-acetylglucosamine 2-epimerase (non-hydrolyzing) [Clostridia bacterium]|nr:UDP-N-acetylglucosamine 2-epimerase (non-hydrolyzing) [Clostridia bacterium]